METAELMLQRYSQGQRSSFRSRGMGRIAFDRGVTDFSLDETHRSGVEEGAMPILPHCLRDVIAQQKTRGELVRFLS